MLRCYYSFFLLYQGTLFFLLFNFFLCNIILFHSFKFFKHFLERSSCSAFRYFNFPLLPMQSCFTWVTLRIKQRHFSHALCPVKLTRISFFKVASVLRNVKVFLFSLTFLLIFKYLKCKPDIEKCIIKLLDTYLDARRNSVKINFGISKIKGKGAIITCRVLFFQWQLSIESVISYKWNNPKCH